MQKVICKVCGTEFEAKTKGKMYCSDKCKRKQSQKVYRDRKKGLLPPAETRKKTVKVNQELVRLTVEAREHGMSYGQYVAMLEMGAR